MRRASGLAIVLALFVAALQVRPAAHEIPQSVAVHTFINPKATHIKQKAATKLFFQQQPRLARNVTTAVDQFEFVFSP